MTSKTGDVEAFDKNWQSREEAHYIHWTRGRPRNQIQLAFRNHWTLFREIMGPGFAGKRALEVGCGRGSMSAYFSEAGFDCTLVDLSSSVIDTARKIFEHHALKARFEVGDALALPYSNGAFDVVYSIGLLEHFEELEKVISEQVRILDRGGLFLGYVVPKFSDNIQNQYEWINQILKNMVRRESSTPANEKVAVFRSDALSASYLPIMKRLGLKNTGSSGVYPLPMISHSIDFPFTLLDENSESVLVEEFEKILARRREETKRHPWLCEEGYGQAFLLWGTKSG